MRAILPLLIDLGTALIFVAILAFGLGAAICFHCGRRR